jgi:hypothetical protein
MTKSATTAQEALEAYKQYFNEDRLVQAAWHKEQDGRKLACGLGVLGDDVSSPRDCPAQIMPRWLAQMVPWFFDSQDADQAKAWGLAFYEQLARIGGNVPFSVIHDWQASVVGPMAIEIAEKNGRYATVHKALVEMQFAALTGKKFTADEWRPTLKAAFLDIYLLKYGADVYADVYANANANVYANVYAYANVNANANVYADVYADAYANADAYVYADVYANANDDAYDDANALYRNHIHRLAMGMIDCLKRVEV